MTIDVIRVFGEAYCYYDGWVTMTTAKLLVTTKVNK